MNDCLDALLARFPLQAGPTQPLPLARGAISLPMRQAPPYRGRLHLLLRGPLQIEGEGTDRERLPREQWLQPALIWLPGPGRQRLTPMSEQGATVLDAEVDLGPPELAPLVDALPARLVLARRDLPAPMAATLALIVAEFEAGGSAHAAVMPRLVEVLLLQWLRHRVELARGTRAGLLAGLADPALASVLDAIHRSPQQPWTLATLAQQASLSRTALAARFTDTVGLPPGDYLIDWRLRCARLALRQGLGVAEVAACVGYSSAAALTHVFSQRLGISPARWRRQQQAAAPAARSAC